MTDRPTQAEGILTQEAHGETVLLRVADGFYYSVDEVGSLVWSLSDGSRSVAEIVTGVCTEFDAPEEQVRPDVEAFLAELAGEGLIRDGA